MSKDDYKSAISVEKRTETAPSGGISAETKKITITHPEMENKEVIFVIHGMGETSVEEFQQLIKNSQRS